MEQTINDIIVLLIALIKNITPGYWGLFASAALILFVMLILKWRKTAQNKVGAEAKQPSSDPLPHEPGIEPELVPQQPMDVSKKPPAPPPPKKVNIVERLKSGLSKTRQFLSADIDALFRGKQNLDDDLLEELEELLITADIGVQTSMDLIGNLSKHSGKITTPEDLKIILKSEILKILRAHPGEGANITDVPRVIMVVGVNGVGKTTTIGKLAHKHRIEGKKVLIAAADTFRAAAVEQLNVWAKRAEADIVKHHENSDPAAVAYDGIEAAMARGVDVVFIDTAGRLHTKVNLMEELKKIKRTVSKKLPGAPHEILLVLDATTGQNALTQAIYFNKVLEITGIALTKVDGTAKGGIVVSIHREMDIPLKYLGVGEKIDDLQNFDDRQFINALF